MKLEYFVKYDYTNNTLEFAFHHRFGRVPNVPIMVVMIFRDGIPGKAFLLL